MFVFINKFRNKVRADICDRLSSSRAQAGIVLLLIIALSLILYAVSMNFGRLSEAKVLTIRAANLSASMMASFIASYGEKLMQEQLGGDMQVCGWTGFFATLLQIIAIIIAIVISYATAGAGADAGWKLVYAALAVAAVATTVSLVMQLTVIQPGITDMWNRMMSTSLSLKDQVVERGIQAALFSLTTDQTLVPDLYDEDSDGFFGNLTVAADRFSAPDYVSRMGHFYTNRLSQAVPPDFTVITDLQALLRETLYAGADGVGFYDPVVLSGHTTCASPPNPTAYPIHPCVDFDNMSAMPAMCDPCCFPPYRRDAEGMIIYEPDGITPQAARPECCDDGILNSCPFFTAEDPTTCGARSPFYTNDGNLNNDYPWVYDMTYENDYNDNEDHCFHFRSIREKFGRDDEHWRFHVNSASPNWYSHPIPSRQIPDGAIVNGSPLEEKFIIDDTTSFYERYFGVQDNRSGIFPALYNLADMGVGLTSLTYGWRECHWCDPDQGVGSPGDSCIIPTGEPQFDIPDLGAAVPPELNNPTLNTWAGGWCVDDANIVGSGDFPLLLDLVYRPDLFALPTDCVQNSGKWKRGADMYCSEVEPYVMNCAKNRNPPNGVPDSACQEFFPDTGASVGVDCECDDAGSDPTMFSGDYLDNFIYGSSEFIRWAEETMSQSPRSIYNYLSEWYASGSSQWIGDPAVQGENVLQSWAEQLDTYIIEIDRWLTADYGAACSEAWCVPRGGCPCEKAEEIAAGTDMAGVVACLDWNANDTITYPLSGRVVTGNYEKFRACFEDCSYEHCHDMPRSLVPDFCLKWVWFHPDPIYQEIYECLVGDARPVADPFTQTFRLDSIPNPTRAVITCGSECGAVPATYTEGPNTVTIDPPYDPPSYTFTCTANTWDCNVGGSFIAAVNAALPIADAAHVPILQNCINAATSVSSQCPGHTENSYWAIRNFSCRGECASLPGSGTAGSYGLELFNEDIEVTAVVSPDSCALDEFFSDAMDMLHLSEDKCLDPVYLPEVEISMNNAYHQTLKLRKRADFLQRRLAEAQEISDVLTEARDMLTSFVNAPEVTAMRNWATGGAPAATADSRTASVVIYAWKDEPTRTRSGLVEEEGYWHAVKAEVRVPGRCVQPGLCGPESDRWPWIRSHTKHGGLKRCYTMTDHTGMVKVRTIRWDQDRDSDTITFPGGVPVWDIELFNPNSGKEEPFNVMATCAGYLDPVYGTHRVDGVGDAWAEQDWGYALMINDRAAGGLNRQCWMDIHNYWLEHGTSSTSCALYYPSNGHFTLRFVLCDDAFIQGWG